jgi:hypothetical protein
VDLDPGGPKTCGSSGSESPTLLSVIYCVLQCRAQYITDLQYARRNPQKYSFVRKVESWNKLLENVKGPENGQPLKRRTTGKSEY